MTVKDSLGDVVPEMATAFLTAFLIWLFGVLVFLPLARRVEPSNLPLIVSVIILLPFTRFLFKGLRGLDKILDRLSKRITHELVSRRDLKKKLSTEKIVRAVVYTVAILIIYLLYSPLLSAIHPSINGIAMVVTIMIIFWILLSKRTL